MTDMGTAGPPQCDRHALMRDYPRVRCPETATVVTVRPIYHTETDGTRVHRPMLFCDEHEPQVFETMPL